MHLLSTSIVIAACLFVHVRAHGALVTITGANGVNAAGFGIDGSTPRTGTTRKPFQQDTSIIRDRDITSGKAGVCGRTLLNGNNDVTSQLANATSAGLPTAAADGTVTMTLHQINGDGAGPYTCEVSTDATGANFKAMTVVTNVPGVNSRSNARATDFPLVAKLPAGTTCTGGPASNACLVRCRNSARAGPFGGCAAVTTSDSASSASSNSTTAGSSSVAADTSTATDTSAAASATDTSSAATDTTAATDASTSKSAAAAAATGAGKGKKAGAKAKGKAAKGGQQKRMMNSRVVGKRQAGMWM